jgi:hypothetical protein
MKKRIVILFAFLLSAFSAIQAQSPWSGFFKPINANIFEQKHQMFTKSSLGNLKLADTVVVMPSAWKFHPAVGITGFELEFNKAAARIESLPLSLSGGVGISYLYFINDNGVPYSPFGASAFIFFDGNGACLVGTISALQYLNFGGGYNFATKHGLFMIGLQYNFNLTNL